MLAIAGVISFPILTRILTVEEYGIMNLISMVLIVIVAFSKLGIQNSVLRTYAEVKNYNSAFSEDNLYATVFSTVIVASIIACAATATAAHFGWLSFVFDEKTSYFLALSAILIIVRVLWAVASNILVAQQRSKLMARFSILQRYLSLAVIIAVLLYTSSGLHGYYYSMIGAEILVLVLLIVTLRNGVHYRPSAFSPPLLKDMAQYGIPLLGLEIASAILSLGDRLIISKYLGSEPLGAYSAAYNLCTYIQLIIIASYGKAVKPMYMHTFEAQGHEPTKQLLDSALAYYAMAALPMITILSVVAPQMLSLLASSKYDDGAVIIPWVVSGLVVNGAIVMVNAGLHLYKKTRLFMYGMIASTVLNIGLNFIFIPRFGILGAALTTLMSYIFLVSLIWFITKPMLQVTIPFKPIVKYLTISVAIYLGTTQIELNHMLATMVVRVAVSTLLFGVSYWLFDKRFRELLGFLQQKILNKSAVT